MEGNKVKTLNPGALNHLDNSNGSKASLKPVLVLARTRASHPFTQARTRKRSRSDRGVDT